MQIWLHIWIPISSYGFNLGTVRFNLTFGVLPNFQICHWSFLIRSNWSDSFNWTIKSTIHKSMFLVVVMFLIMLCCLCVIIFVNGINLLIVIINENLLAQIDYHENINKRSYTQFAKHYKWKRFKFYGIKCISHEQQKMLLCSRNFVVTNKHNRTQ